MGSNISALATLHATAREALPEGASATAPYKTGWYWQLGGAVVKENGFCFTNDLCYG
jgi:hypothetical protein